MGRLVIAHSVTSGGRPVFSSSEVTNCTNGQLVEMLIEDSWKPIYSESISGDPTTILVINTGSNDLIIRGFGSGANPYTRMTIPAGAAFIFRYGSAWSGLAPSLVDVDLYSEDGTTATVGVFF